MSSYLLKNGGGGLYGGDVEMTQIESLYQGVKTGFELTEDYQDAILIWEIDAHGGRPPVMYLDLSIGTLIEETNGWEVITRYNNMDVNWYRRYRLTAKAGSIISWMGADSARGSCVMIFSGGKSIIPIPSGATAIWTLLWKNQNLTPNYTFDAQTINLELTGYESIAIEGISAGVYPPHDARFNGEYQLGVCQNRVGRYCYIGSYGNIATARKVTVVNDGLQFGIGYQGTTQYNTVSIPYKIWGINKLAIPSEVYSE